MRKPEDPCRDPASEARDDWEQLCQPLTNEERRENARKIEALSVPDRFALMFSHASEPRATAETDAMEAVWNDLGVMVVASGFARRLERQRDEAREHAANAEVSLKMAINSANARQAETEHAMRQRDELMEAIRRLAADFECEGDEFRAESWRSFIAAVKGGTP